METQQPLARMEMEVGGESLVYKLNIKLCTSNTPKNLKATEFFF